MFENQSVLMPAESPEFSIIINTCPQLNAWGYDLKLLLIVLLLSIAAYAQSLSCPPGCVCLSGSEFQSKYSRQFNSGDLCPAPPHGTNPLPCPQPYLCFKNIPVVAEPECSGNFTLSLDHSTAGPGTSILASAAGIASCENSTISVLQGHCNSNGTPLCSCIVSNSSCSCRFPAPSEAGVFDYYACTGLGKGVMPLESAPASLAVEGVQQNQYGCFSDLDCPGDSRCSDGSCILITGVCGYASNQSWISYACGPEQGCPQCAGNASCENHTCIVKPSQALQNNQASEQKNETKAQGAAPQRSQLEAALSFILYSAGNPAIKVGILVILVLGALGYWIYRRKLKESR